MKNPHISGLHFYLSKEDKDRFTQICNREGVGKSEILRRLVKDIVKKGEL